MGWGAYSYGEDGPTLDEVAAQGADLAETLNEGSDNSILGNVSRFLGRPGYAVRSLLRGEFVDAAENIIQMGMDYPTFGWANRNWSIANLFSDTGDITTRDERPEFSDLVGYEGQGLGRIALDVVGGMITDPLTYLTFGGGGIAKGTFHGLDRGAAAGKLTMALGKTKAGSSLLAGAIDDVLRNLQGPLGDAFRNGVFKSLDDLAGAADNVLAPLFPGIAADDLGRSAAQTSRHLHEMALEQIVKSLDPLAELGVNTGGADAILDASNLMDGVIEKLIGKGAVIADDAVRFELPFADTIFRQTGIEARSGPMIRDFWGKAKSATAPGIGLKLTELVSKETAELARTTGAWAGDEMRRLFFDAYAKSGVPQGLEHAARKLKYVYQGDVKRAAYRVIETFGDLDEAQIHDLGVKVSLAEDFYVEQLGKLKEQAYAQARSAALQAGKPADEVMKAAKAAQDAVVSLPTGQIEAIQRQMLGRFQDPRMAKAFKGYLEAMQEIPDELVELGVWSDNFSNPWYMPHQIGSELAELMVDPNAGKRGEILQGVKDVFTRRREFSTVEDYANAITFRISKQAQKAGDRELIQRMLDMGLIKPAKKGDGYTVVRGLGVVGGAVETNLKELMFKRLAAHAQTRWRRGLWNEGVKQGMWVTGDGFREGMPALLRDYVDGQLKFKGVPDSAIYKLLAGGDVKIPLGEAGKAPAWAKKAGFEVAEEGGRRWLKGRVQGLNYYWKPLLTSFPTNVDFQIRNQLGAMAMTSLDPDLGYKTFRETLISFPFAAWAEKLQGKLGRSDVRQVIRAAQGVDGAMDALRASGARFGLYSLDEVVEIVQNGVAKVNQADLKGSLTAMDDAVQVLAGTQIKRPDTYTGAAASLYDTLVNFGEGAANHLESGARTAAILELLGKGEEATEAIRRANRVFVDYSATSTAQAWARQFLPFVQFQLGAAQWAGEFARRPKLLAPLAHLRNSAQGQLGEGEVLPEAVQSSFAIPLGKTDAGERRYLMSLGLPHEATLNTVGAVTSFEGLRKGALAAMHPLLKFPLEGATNRDFYFGDEFGSYTKAPTYARGVPFGGPSVYFGLNLVKETELPDGSIRYEVPGFWREVFDTLPISRASNMVDRMVQADRPLWDALLQNTTGMRTRGVDEEKELGRALTRYLKAKVESGHVSEFTQWVAKGDPEDAPEDLKLVLKTLSRVRRERAEKRKQLTMGRPGGL